MEIVYKSINEIIPYINNARTHSKDQVKQIASSIKEFGFTNPILIDESNGIIAGHGRLLGAEMLKMETVPCIVLSGLTEAQKKAYIIADNKLALNAGWNEELLKIELENLEQLNFDMDLTGFNADELLELFKREKEVEEDNYEVELPEEPKAKYGEVYQLGNHRLMCGDSTLETDVKKLIGDNEMDLCLTDPPYNVNYVALSEPKYGKEKEDGERILNDNMDDASFYEFLKAFYEQMLRVLKPGGSFYIFHADLEGYNFRKALLDAGGQIRQNLIWVKNALVIGRQDYQWKHEPILYGWRDGGTHYFTNSRKNDTVIEDVPNFNKMKAGEMKQLLKEIYSDKTQTSILHEDKPTRNDVHPTMKPLKLCGRLVANSSKEGETVIDFFGGSGSTMMACEQLDRICYMMELDPKYIDVIIDRWQKLTGKEAILISEGAIE